MNLCLTRLRIFFTTDVTVRITTVQTLGDLKISGSREPLERVLRTDDVPEVAFAAAEVLYVMGDPAGRTALLGVYSSKVKPGSTLLRQKSRQVFRSFRSLQSATTLIVGEGIGYVPVPGVGEGFAA